LLDVLEKGLLRDGAALSRNADALLLAKQASGKITVYKDGSATIFLRSKPTRYEVLHELQHLEHLREIGAQRYISLARTRLGNVELEQTVYNKLRRYHWDSLNTKEQTHAQYYIRRLGGNAW